MAIDTAEKRRTASGVAFLPFGPSVTPNASKDAGWRYQVGWSFRETALGDPDGVFNQLGRGRVFQQKARGSVFIQSQRGRVFEEKAT